MADRRVSDSAPRAGPYGVSILSPSLILLPRSPCSPLTSTPLPFPQRDAPRRRGPPGSGSGSYAALDSGGAWAHDAFESLHSHGPGSRPAYVGPSRRLKVEQLHYEVTEQELQGLFQSIGTVTDGPRIAVSCMVLPSFLPEGLAPVC